MKMRY
ncbi:hypothetical protein LINPERPRIM_LOCUS14838 [Linum perenne]